MTKIPARCSSYFGGGAEGERVEGRGLRHGLEEQHRGDHHQVGVPDR